MSKELANLASQAVSSQTGGLNKVAEQVKAPAGQTPAGKDVLLFAQVLEQNQKMSADLIKSFGIGIEGGPQLKSIAADSVTVDTSKLTEGVGSEGQIQTKNKVGDILAEVNRGQLQMQGIMDMALSGRRFSPTELLAMQAGVYQIAQEMELTSKVFEQVNTAHKTLWNTNFQG